MRCPRARPAMRIASRGARAVLADDRGQQFALAVSRDAGDTDDLAAAHGEVDGAERLAGADRSAASDRSRTSSAGSPGVGRSRRVRGGSLPIIIRDRLATVSRAGSQRPVTLPARITVAREHSVRTSSSLWLM